MMTLRTWLNSFSVIPAILASALATMPLLAAEPIVWEQKTNYSKVAWSPDGKQLALGQSLDGAVQILTLAPLKEQQRLEFPDSMILAVSYFPDGEHLLVVWVARSFTKGGTVVRNLKTRTVAWEADAPLAFGGIASPDGRHIATTGGYSVLVRDFLKKEMDQRYKAHEGFESESATYTRDGRGLAAGSADGSIVAFSTKDGDALFTLRGHQGKVQAVSFGPQNAVLASGGEDKQVILWALKDGKPVWKATHDDAVSSVAVSPDGKLVASGCRDKSVKLWEAGTGKLQETLDKQSQHVLGLAWHPGGHLLAVTHGGGMVIYPVHPAPVVTIPLKAVAPQP
jgi:WD40 repeat protein